jgi:chromosome segregation ATPase
MCKKLVIVGIAVVAVALVLRKTDLASHARLCWKNAKNDIKKEVPLEWEIDRLRMEIDTLAKEEKKHIAVMAEESVAIDTLEADIERMQTHLSTQWAKIEQMTKDVESGKEYITYGDVNYSVSRVKTMLTREFNGYKDGQKGLKSKQGMLNERKASLQQAQDELFAMKDARRDLEDELVSIETQLKALRVAQARSKVQYDDSKLAKIKEGVANLKTRVAVERKKLDYQAEFNTGVVPTEKQDKEKTKDIVEEIRSFKSANGSK